MAQFGTLSLYRGANTGNYLNEKSAGGSSSGTLIPSTVAVYTKDDVTFIPGATNFSNNVRIAVTSGVSGNVYSMHYSIQMQGTNSTIVFDFSGLPGFSAGWANGITYDNNRIVCSATNGVVGLARITFLSATTFRILLPSSSNVLSGFTWDMVFTQ